MSSWGALRHMANRGHQCGTWGGTRRRRRGFLRGRYRKAADHLNILGYPHRASVIHCVVEYLWISMGIPVWQTANFHLHKKSTNHRMITRGPCPHLHERREPQITDVKTLFVISDFKKFQYNYWDWTPTNCPDPFQGCLFQSED